MIKQQLCISIKMFLRKLKICWSSFYLLCNKANYFSPVFYSSLFHQTRLQLMQAMFTSQQQEHIDENREKMDDERKWFILRRYYELDLFLTRHHLASSSRFRLSQPPTLLLPFPHHSPLSPIPHPPTLVLLSPSSYVPVSLLMKTDVVSIKFTW